MTGFEPAASSSRTKRATGLRYIPLERLNYKSFCFLQIFLQKISCCNRIAGGWQEGDGFHLFLRVQFAAAAYRLCLLRLSGFVQ